MSRLCVPILVEDAEDASRALENAAVAAELGATLVEWRVDPLAGDPHGAAAASRLLTESPMPAILTCRDPEEGGAFETDDDERAALLRAIAEREPRPRYVDVELAAWERSPALREAASELLGPDTSLILSTHDFFGRPRDLWQRLERMASIDACDIIKVAWFARSLRDILEVADVIAARLKPTIALAMGPYGSPSRVLAGKLGGLLTFASLGDGTATAPGQPTLAVMKHVFRFPEISRTTATYGIAGDPVEHSHGPIVHNAGFRAIGHDGVYLPMPIPAGWESFLATVGSWLDDERLGLRGLSVTLPHKTNLLRFVRDAGGDVSPLAALVGAANTLSVQGDGATRILLADNTDAPAIVAAIAEAIAGPAAERSGAAGAGAAAGAAGARADGAAAETLSFAGPAANPGVLLGRHAVILGAGGAARAAAAGLAYAGMPVTVLARRPDAAAEIAADLHGKPDASDAPMHVIAGRLDAAGAEAAIGAGPSVIVNATPVGMATGDAPDGDPLPASVELGSDHIVFDTVYVPRETPLIRRARAAGAGVITGDVLFVGQADRQFQQWTGQPLPPEAIAAVPMERRPAE
ncbi:MAG: type I 3-dehydroquinate dehydratase [Phycisphaerales bacterium]